MSAYNTVGFSWENPKTKEMHNVLIQFKYGEVWQHAYKVGDALLWGNNDIGNPSAKKVVVEGVLEGDKLSNEMPEDFEIYIIDNKIESIKPFTNTYNFSKTENDYIVLD